MFKVNNKDTFWTCFTPCSSVSIVNFEQVNADWECFVLTLLSFENKDRRVTYQEWTFSLWRHWYLSRWNEKKYRPGINVKKLFREKKRVNQAKKSGAGEKIVRILRDSFKLVQRAGRITFLEINLVRILL